MKKQVIIILILLVVSIAYVVADSDDNSSVSSEKNNSESSDDSNDTESENEDYNQKERSRETNIKKRSEVKVETNGNGTIRIEQKTEVEEETGERRTIIKERVENEEERKEIVQKFREHIIANDGVIDIKGKIMIIKDINGSDREIIIGKIKVRMRVDITSEENATGDIDELKAILSNGSFSHIRIMPDLAVAIALNRLRAQCEENNCSVELSEVDKGNIKKLVYRVQTKKDGRLFFIFKTRLQVLAEVDPNTGEIVVVEKPWWAFLVKEKNEEPNDVENNERNETDEMKKVTICHIPSGNASAAHTISVGEAAVTAHLAHGDSLGACITTNNSSEIPSNETTNNSVSCYGEGSIPVYPGAECCSGFTRILPKEEGILGSALCTNKCGNGICDTETESSYNCPQDCQTNASA